MLRSLHYYYLSEIVVSYSFELRAMMDLPVIRNYVSTSSKVVLLYAFLTLNIKF